MFKKLTVLIICALTVFSFAACSKKSETSNAENIISPLRMVDLQGEVESINGSTITLKVISPPYRGFWPREDNRDGRGPERGENRPSRPDPSASPRSTERSERKEPEIQYTGEKMDITVLPETKILKLEPGGDGMQQVEISLEDIAVGQILNVYYNIDKTAVEKIMVFPLEQKEQE